MKLADILFSSFLLFLLLLLFIIVIIIIKYYYYYLLFLSLINYLLYRVLYRKNTVPFWGHILGPSDWLAGDYQPCTWIHSPSDPTQFLGLEEAIIPQCPRGVGGNIRGLAIKSSAPGPAPARDSLHMVGWGQPYKWSARTLPFPKLILSRPWVNQPSLFCSHHNSNVTSSEKVFPDHLKYNTLSHSMGP